MSTPQEFKISVPDEDIAFLKRKLELTRFPDELDGSEWKYGIPLADMQRLVAHWKDGYDWRKHEKELNDELPQFTVDIDVEGFETLNIHFIHKKSETANAVPLLFVHGCKQDTTSYASVDCTILHFVRARELHRSQEDTTLVDKHHA